MNSDIYKISMDEMYTFPKSLEMKNFVFNPIAVINECPTVYLIYRPEHEIKVAMDEYDNTGRRDAGNCNCKLVPKKCIGNSKDGKLFQQKSEEKSTTVTKVTTCQLKILSLMDELEKTLKKVPKSTDPIDQFKQRKLFSDFIVRFSRNYVYEVDKIIEEIHFYQVDHYSYFERSTNHLLNKVCNLFTTIMRALQVYQKQLEKMNNESSDKLLHFTELIIIGISICVELKIFDDGDILIKLLLEKSEKFVAFLRENDNQPLAKEQEIKPPTLSTSLAKDDFKFDLQENIIGTTTMYLDVAKYKENVAPFYGKKFSTKTKTRNTQDICLPRQNRFMMYAPTSKKLKASKSSTTVSRAVSKTKVKGRSAVMNHNHPRSDELPSGNIDAMIESKVGVGSSEKSSGYMEVCDQIEGNPNIENSEVENANIANDAELLSLDDE